MNLVTCNFKDKKDHCKQVCQHGDAHERDIGKDSCLIPEMCFIVGKKVKCRKLYKKEIKLLGRENEPNNDNTH